MIRATIYALAIVLVTAQFSFAQATTQPAGVSGTYKWTTQGFGGDQESSMTLKQDGDKLTGSVSGFGGDSQISEGKVTAAGEVSFKVTRDFNGNPVTTIYSGKVSGNSFKGKSETIFAQPIDAKRGS